MYTETINENSVKYAVDENDNNIVILTLDYWNKLKGLPPIPEWQKEMSISRIKEWEETGETVSMEEMQKIFQETEEEDF